MRGRALTALSAHGRRSLTFWNPRIVRLSMARSAPFPWAAEDRRKEKVRAVRRRDRGPKVVMRWESIEGGNLGRTVDGMNAKEKFDSILVIN
jgi:hypothetical protein